MKHKSRLLKFILLVFTLFTISAIKAQVKYYAVVEYCSNRDAFDDESTQVYYLCKPIDITNIVTKYEKSTEKYKDQKFHESIWKLFKLKLYAQYKIEVKHEVWSTSSSTHTMWYNGLEYIYSDNISPTWKNRTTTVGQEDTWWSYDVANKFFEYVIDWIKLKPNHVLKIIN